MVAVLMGVEGKGVSARVSPVVLATGRPPEDGRARAGHITVAMATWPAAWRDPGRRTGPGEGASGRRPLSGWHSLPWRPGTFPSDCGWWRCVPLRGVPLVPLKWPFALRPYLQMAPTGVEGGHPHLQVGQHSSPRHHRCLRGWARCRWRSELDADEAWLG